jgi:plasmid stabilization system protein ParE
MAGYAFHPEALAEFEDAARYYLEEASPVVASAFVAAVESAIEKVIASPMAWRVIDESAVRRYLLSRFPLRAILPLGSRA